MERILIQFFAVGLAVAIAITSALPTRAQAQAQAQPLSGRVTNLAGAPLPGVFVRILAGAWSDTTDTDGRYALEPSVSIQTIPGRAPRAVADPALLLQSRARDNLDVTLHDLQGRRPGHGSRLSAGAFVARLEVDSRPGSDPRTSPSSQSAPAPSRKVSAAPGTWVQAFKPGYTLASKQVAGNTGTLDFVLAAATGPDFGPNVLLFDTTMPMADIQSQLDTLFNRQVRAQFGADRYAVLFKPGVYDLNIDVGYYTQVLGLGYFPNEVEIRGSVRSQTGHGTPATNVTTQFWRGVENLTITPTNVSKTLNWAVSQAAPFRRNHVKGNLNLSIGGWASGGYLADTKVDGAVSSGSQQQWFSRNSQWTSWSGGVWNMFFLGVTAPPSGTWPTQPYTVVPETPILREKPWLRLSSNAGWGVLVPSLRVNGKGTSWEGNQLQGMTYDTAMLHIARPGPGDAATLNAALAKGKNLLLTPGIYYLDAPLQVNHPRALVFGLGMATLVPTEGTAALRIKDVPGVTVSGIVVDAGPKNSPVLLQVGEPGSSVSHAANPTVLHDVFLRVGGPREGSADVTVEINSHDVILDHFWVWRADHGLGARWEVNKGKNGLIVRGKNVTAYGLFVEHYQEYQTLWEGENGRTYFYQCELPYDPPSQDLWQHDGVKGYAGYKVADGVTTHQAMGLGVYSAFKQPVQCDHAVEAPVAPGVKLSHIVSIWLNGAEGSGINNVLNKTGGAVTKTKTKATID